MMNKKLLHIASILGALVLSIALVFLWPNGNSTFRTSGLNFEDENAVIHQSIVGMKEQPVEVTKVYYKDQLIGIVQNEAVLEANRKRAYNAYYAANFPGAVIRFDDDLFFYREKTYNEYENKDNEIGYYLFDKDMFLVECYRVEIGEDKVMYVKNLDDFRNAIRNLAKIFVNEDVYVRLDNNEKSPSLTTVGEQDVNVYIEEEIRCTEDNASASNVFSNYEEIMRYLCFGEDYELQYGIVKEYDTIAGFAMRYGLTSEQLVMINPTLNNVNQVITAGEQLITTYFRPVLHVVVEHEKYTRETIYQPSTKFITDNTLPAGEAVVDVEGSDGIRESLYKEIYVNGVLTSYKVVSTKVTKPAVQKVVSLGAMAIYYYEGQFHFPVQNPHIICGYLCYSGHYAIDVQNRYNHWSDAYACADGTIVANSWMWDGGWYIIIDHGNGYRFMYCHFRSKCPYPVGTKVVQGQWIAYVGMTGQATTPHVHIKVTLNGVKINPCLVMPCEQAW
ncbi:MAG: peptidoglycan DD-metalloendopeptidase family protein [Erysipelotrichaceae bacterium]|nr:peptidoglycan DD-metalloendopeptidase family protein [Erysipelotrichaceae bacterium]